MRGFAGSLACVVSCSALGCGLAANEAYLAPEAASATSVGAVAGRVRAADSTPAGAGAEAPQRGRVPPLSVVEKRKLVYTGQFKLIVSDVAAAQTATKDLAEKLGGYLEKMDARMMIVRVPAARFNEAVAALGRIGTIAARTIQAEDVTDRFLDLHTRLQNARALAGRLRALLDKTGNIDEALRIEQELTRVQAEIDKLEALIKHTSEQIAYAKLSIEFHGAVQYTPPALRVKLPIGWLRDLGLNNLLRFGGQELY